MVALCTPPGGCGAALLCATFNVLAALQLKSGKLALLPPLAIFCEWLAHDGVLLLADADFELPAWRGTVIHDGTCNGNCLCWFPNQ